MKKIILLSLLAVLNSVQATVMTCPNPETTSLKWGVPPPPWIPNPFSPNCPQGEEGTKFVRANILVAGSLGLGVTCTYRNSVGDYSIWWSVAVKRPASVDYNWIDTVGGFLCTDSLKGCRFSVAIEQ